MNKKSIILCSTMIILPLLANAEDFATNGIYYNIISSEDKTVAITFKGTNQSTYNDEYQGTVEIPTTIKYYNTTYNVIAIGEGAFSGCKGLTSITIPESVTEIRSNAFRNCSALSTVTFAPNSRLEIIEESAFGDCGNLASISIPESVTYIGVAAFCNCKQLKFISFSENSQLSTIDRCAFQSCWSLTSVEIPKGVTNIGYSNFCDCSSLSNVTIHKNVKQIDEMAFAYCYYLKDVFCHADSVPTTHIEAFKNVSLTNVTLHVPSKAIENYSNSAPWKNYGTIKAIKIPVVEITLSHTSVTLTEGKSLTLTATVTPTDADIASVTWNSSNEDVAIVSSKGKVIAMVSGVATITATANDGSEVSASCEVIVKEESLGKCETPSISYADGKINLSCTTESVEFVTDVVTDMTGIYKGQSFEFIPTYYFTVYATKEDFENSDAVQATICWIECNEGHESEETDILTIPSKPMLIQSQSGVISIIGLADETTVVVYDVSGLKLATSTATNGIATLSTNLASGAIAIVKIGEYSVKIKL